MSVPDSSKTPRLFYAHSTDRRDCSDWQLLDDHQTNVAELAADFAKIFGADGSAYIAGLLHDLGKYTEEVQRRVAGENIRGEHAIQGARQAIERYGKLGTLLAYTIAGHHAGLANGRDIGTRRSSLKERLARSGTPELLPAWQTEVSLPEQCPLPQDFKPHPDPALGAFQLAFFTRMLYSCVVDADFLDTEAFYDKVGNRPSLRDSGPALAALQVELNKTLSKFKTDSEVNRLRADILRHVRARAALAPGLFSLTVPTGGGKTLTSLAFALDHALTHQPTHPFRRVIYVIPFTSIIEQNAAEFRKAFGELGEAAVLEHHNAFDDNKLKDRNSRDKLRIATENWDRPVIVTTAVQFFESLFADRSSRCRKLHNIAGSVIILDEAQTLPIKLLRPCVAAIDELARNYRCSIVLCTATQPALNANDANPAEGFPNGLTHVRELAPEPRNLYRQLERVRVTHIGEQDDDALTKRLKENPQVLCIVNNRRHARALFDAIREEPGARHLSTFMCARHRSQVLSAIRDDLLPENNRPCRLVSTSLIEAGMNADFPYVLRAETGLDSVAQAAGRCNREGRRARDDSLVHVFLAVGWSPPSELKQFAQAMRQTLRHHAGDPLSLDAIDAYFHELYWQKGEEALDAYDILGILKSGDIDGIPFETIAEKFRMIDNVLRPIIVPFKANGEEESPIKALLQKLRFVESPSAIARALQPYTVQVPESVFRALHDVGAVQPEEEQRFGDQFMVLANENLYDDRVGLLWENPAFVEAERLVW
ncbi:MAG: CRISPR-associated endonuclease Cas3'' [Betaproteobacteria bacterium]|nr:CRISPR-associated endonuclease Cas3'' [Betaproteobacteria bacterium]